MGLVCDPRARGSEVLYTLLAPFRGIDPPVCSESPKHGLAICEPSLPSHVMVAGHRPGACLLLLARGCSGNVCNRGKRGVFVPEPEALVACALWRCGAHHPVDPLLACGPLNALLAS